MFVFSTNTNNVPVSTNTILAIGPNGQMVASNTLYNLSTYGVGYLPSTLSSLEGEIVSIGNLVLSGGVVPAQLFSVQTALQSSISSTQGSVDTLSSYILLNVIPSTVSTFDAQVSSLNSSFQGYVAGTSVTPVQLASTYTAATTYTDQQISTLSTNTYIQICTLSNYFDVSSATVTQFSTLAGNVSAQSNYFSLQIYLLGSNFNALSANTRILNQSNSTLVGELVNEVEILSTNFSSYLSSLEAEVNYLSSITVNPGAIIGLLSTSAYNNYPFFSNIKVSSIDIRAAGTAAAPALSFTSGSDNDTGIYHPGDGVIAFTTNSGERLRIQGNATFGSTYINLYGTSNGFATLNPFNFPVLALTSGCNNNANSARIELNMPSTSFKTFVGGGTGTSIEYRQLQTYAYDIPGGTICTATSVHSTGNFAIRAPANGSNALYVNGSTFINGQLGIAASGSAAAPALYFSEAGNDTGFFKPGDGILAVTTNGTERYRFSGASFAGSNTNGIISLDYTSKANLQLGSFCNDNSYAPYLLMCNALTGVGFQTWCGGSTDFPGLGFTDQLVTKAYPSGVNALAIASNGSVGIGGGADPFFALTVYGGIRQTTPYLWSYQTTVYGASPLGYNPLSWSQSNALGPGGTGNLVTGQYFVVPYQGVYNIIVSGQASNVGGVNVRLNSSNYGQLWNVYTNVGTDVLSYNFAGTFLVGDGLCVQIFTASAAQFGNCTWTIQYLG